MKPIINILHKDNFVCFSCRAEIMQAIASLATPLPGDEIEVNANSNFFCTKFHNTFKTLIAKGGIHKIVINNTLGKYSLSQNQDTKKQNTHFYCFSYKKMYCLPQLQWGYPYLHGMYKTAKTGLLINGYCKNCN